MGLHSVNNARICKVELQLGQSHEEAMAGKNSVRISWAKENREWPGKLENPVDDSLI